MLLIPFFTSARSYRASAGPHQGRKGRFISRRRPLRPPGPAVPGRVQLIRNRFSAQPGRPRPARAENMPKPVWSSDVIGERMAETDGNVNPIAHPHRQTASLWLTGYSPAATKKLFGCPEGRNQTHLPRREGLFVRVNHHGLGVVIGKRVIVAGIDDPFGNLGRCPCRRDTVALGPEPQVAQDRGLCSDTSMICTA